MNRGRRTADLCAQWAYLRTFLCRLGSLAARPSTGQKQSPGQLQAGKGSATGSTAIDTNIELSVIRRTVFAHHLLAKNGDA
jgi:hypothetical protein